jgi:hypothetical protein
VYILINYLIDDMSQIITSAGLAADIFLLLGGFLAAMVFTKVG